MFNSLKKFLKKLEEANTKSFGNGKLDCCNFNKDNKPISKINTENKKIR